MIRRIHDVLFTPIVDRRVVAGLLWAVFSGALAVALWNHGSRWLAALNAACAALQTFGAVVRIVHLRRPS